MTTLLARELQLAHIPTREELAFTDRFPKDWMEAQRFVGDPLADEVIATLAQRMPIRAPDDLLAEVRRLAESEGGVFRRYIEACCYVPAWADFRAMEAGARLYASMGPLVALSILGGGVAGSAWHVDAEPVFTSTGRFVVERGVYERLVETGAIMFLLPLPGEVQPGGRHHNVVMKVRLLHAAIRHWTKSDRDYPEQRVGVPINQEDMAYAILLFTYLTVRGLFRLGLTVSDEQIASLHLLWRYIGHVIGVDDRWLCADIGEQRDLYRAFLARHARPGIASVAALNLLDGAMARVPGPLRGFALRTIHQLTAHLGGAQYLDGLHLETRGSRAGLVAVQALARLYDRILRIPLGEELLYRLGMMSIRRQYSAFGNPADAHGYGVKTYDRAEIAAAIEARRKTLARERAA